MLMKKRVLISKRSFSLAELLIAVALMGLIILAVTSVSITSYRFFGAAKKESRVLDEAKIAMEHMVKNLQLGIGDMTNPSTPVGSPPLADDSRGFLILDGAGGLVASGTTAPQIRVKRDGLKTGVVDGRFDPTGSDDGIIEYRYDPANYKIVYDPDIGLAGDEDLTDEMISDANFEEINYNELKVTIEVLRDPSKPESLENPETTLTSSIVLRAMSTN